MVPIDGSTCSAGAPVGGDLGVVGRNSEDSVRKSLVCVADEAVMLVSDIVDRLRSKFEIKDQTLWKIERDSNGKATYHLLRSDVLIVPVWERRFDGLIEFSLGFGWKIVVNDGTLAVKEDILYGSSNIQPNCCAVKHDYISYLECDLTSGVVEPSDGRKELVFCDLFGHLAGLTDGKVGEQNGTS